jgi:predicted lipid carrier protein YhbT
VGCFYMFDIKRVSHKLVALLPTLAQRVQQLTPKRVQQQGLTLLLNKFFQPELTAGSLDFLAQRYLVLQVSDWQLSFAITLKNNKLQVELASVQQDLLIKASSQDFLDLICGKVDPDTLFFRRRLSMLGDTELGLYCKNLLDTIELSRLPPPLPALLLSWQNLLATAEVAADQTAAVRGSL